MMGMERKYLLSGRVHCFIVGMDGLGCRLGHDTRARAGSVDLELNVDELRGWTMDEGRWCSMDRPAVLDR